MKKQQMTNSPLLLRTVLPFFLGGLPLCFATAGNTASANAFVQQQKYTVQGVVTDENGESLIGVTVKVDGEKGAGAVTDIDGRYRITFADRNATLTFSSIGYTAQTVSVAGRSTLNVTMKEENSMIGEVVVTAMGIRRKEESLTYATQQIKSSDLMKVQDPNVANSLEGKISGITITPSAGGAGGASKIILRGNKSVLGSSAPLIVVDGVPMSNDPRSTIGDASTMTYANVSEGSDALSMINPDDIESINVLKGANAAALYGSKAANGVLMITTKKGREGKMSIGFTSNVTFDTPLTTPEIQNVYGAAIDRANGKMGVYSWGDKLSSIGNDELLLNVAMGQEKFGDQVNQVHLRNVAGDDLADFYRTGVTTNNSISLSGGTETSRSYFSYGNSYANGMVEKNSYVRNTISVRQNFEFFKRIHIDMALNYINTTTRNRPGGGVSMNPIYHMYTMPRNVDIGYYRNNYVAQDGKWNSEPQRIYERAEGGNYAYTSKRAALTGPMQRWAFMGPGQNNPYWLLNMNNGRTTDDRLFGNVTGRVDLFAGLSFQARLGLDVTKSESESRRYATTWNPAGMEDFGRYWWEYGKTTDLYLDYLLSYNKRFGDFDVSATAGYVQHTVKGYAHSNDVTATYIDPQRRKLSTLVNYFTTSAGDAGATTESKTSNWDKGAVFTAQVGWQDKVFVDGAYRQDWYRAFRQYRNMGFSDSYGYWGVGANAIVSSLVKLPEWFNYLKYRLSYTEAGNSIPNTLQGRVSYNYNTGAVNVSGMAEFKDPKPENTGSFETGVEMQFLNNRLSVDLTYYRADVSNLYMTGRNASGKSIPISSGKVRNQGFEGTVAYNFSFGKNASWRTSYNLSYNDNKILRTAYDPETGLETVVATDLGGVRVLYKEGGSIGDMYITDLMRDEKGHYVLDSQGGVQMETATDKKYGVYVGNMNSKWQMGWTNTFTYKDFSLSMLINGRIGGKVLSLTESYLDGFGLSQRSADARLYAEANNIVATEYGNKPGMALPDGSGRIVPVEAFYSTAGGVSTNDLARYLYSGTNFRLRELSLGYTFRDLLGANRNVTLSFIGRNLFFIYKDAPVDPDISLSTANGLGAFEVFNLPSSRSFGFSLNVNF